MPLTHINCAAPKYRNAGIKHEVSLADCLECAATRQNSCQFTFELLAAIFAQQQNRDYISTTVLTGACLRSTFYERSVDYAQDPEKLFPSFRGTMYHGQLEKNAHLPHTIEEARYFVELPEGWLSGSPDLLDVDQGILYDYKTSKEVPRFNYAYKDHCDQMNINRWLIDHADYVVYRGEQYDLAPQQEMLDKLDAEEQDAYIETCGYHRSKFVPEQWTDLVVVYLDSSGPKPIGVTKSIQVPKKNGDGTKAMRVLDLWEDEFAETLIRERYVEAQLALEDGQLPDVPANMEGWDHPICVSWCPHRARCQADHAATAVSVQIAKT